MKDEEAAVVVSAFPCDCPDGECDGYALVYVYEDGMTEAKCPSCGSVWGLLDEATSNSRIRWERRD